MKTFQICLIILYDKKNEILLIESTLYKTKLNASTLQLHVLKHVFAISLLPLCPGENDFAINLFKVSDLFR
jgi:hypothetical protein